MVFGVLDDRRPVVVSDHPLVLLLVRAPAWGHGMLVIAALILEGVSKVSEKYRFFKHLRAKQPLAHVFWGAVPPYFACASACGSEVARPLFLRLPLIGVGESEALIDAETSRIQKSSTPNLSSPPYFRSASCFMCYIIFQQRILPTAVPFTMSSSREAGDPRYSSLQPGLKNPSCRAGMLFSCSNLSLGFQIEMNDDFTTSVGIQ